MRTHKKRSVLLRDTQDIDSKSKAKRHSQAQDLRRKISALSITVKRRKLLEANSTSFHIMAIAQIFKTGILRDKTEISYSLQGMKITLISEKAAVIYKATVCQGPDHRIIIMSKNRLVRLNSPARQPCSNSNSKRAFRSDNSNSNKLQKCHTDRVTHLQDLVHLKTNSKTTNRRPTQTTLVSKQSRQWQQTIKHRNKQRPLSKGTIHHILIKVSVH